MICTPVVRTLCVRLSYVQEVRRSRVVTPGRELKSDRLYLRVSPAQREVISEAADATHKDLSSFVLDAAITSAQRVLADRRVFSLDQDRWERFAEALDRPVATPESKPRLRKLLHESSVLDQ